MSLARSIISEMSGGGHRSDDDDKEEKEARKLEHERHAKRRSDMSSQKADVDEAMRFPVLLAPGTPHFEYKFEGESRIRAISRSAVNRYISGMSNARAVLRRSDAQAVIVGGEDDIMVPSIEFTLNAFMAKLSAKGHFEANVFVQKSKSTPRVRKPRPAGGAGAAGPAKKSRSDGAGAKPKPKPRKPINSYNQYLREMKVKYDKGGTFASDLDAKAAKENLTRSKRVTGWNMFVQNSGWKGLSASVKAGYQKRADEFNRQDGRIV